MLINVWQRVLTYSVVNLFTVLQSNRNRDFCRLHYLTGSSFTRANIVTNDDDGRERPAYTHYTEDDERNMVDWLAKHHPHKEGRENKRIWNQLYNDPVSLK
jgi:hypothetical protein